VAQSAALAEKFHYMCYALATYGQAAVAIFHFLREGKKLCVWGWFVRVPGREGRMVQSVLSFLYTQVLVGALGAVGMITRSSPSLTRKSGKKRISISLNVRGGVKPPPCLRL
jgi:hypothetical protein